MLQCERNKDVRKHLIGSMAVSDAWLPTILARTRDVSEDVRKMAYIVLGQKVPLRTLSISQRAEVLGQGLAERAEPVRAQAAAALQQWLEGEFGGRVLELLNALDVELHEAVAENVVKALIASGKSMLATFLPPPLLVPPFQPLSFPSRPALVSAGTIKPADACKKAAAELGGFHRLTGNPDDLMGPEEALYWRVLAEWLHDNAEVGGPTGSGGSLVVHGRQGQEGVQGDGGSSRLGLGRRCSAESRSLARCLIPLFRLKSPKTKREQRR